MTHAIDKENRVSRNSTDTLQRQWHMLRMIPRAPRHITAGELCEGLAQRGIRAGKRTIERDLQNLLGTFPLELDETARPFLWSWHKDANFDFMPRLSVPQGMALLLAQQHLKTLLPAATQRELQPLFQMARRELAAGVWKDWHQRTAVQPSVKTLLAPQLDAEVLDDVHEALALRRQLSVIYRSKGAREGRRALIHPLGLIIRGQVHYLACTFDGYQDIRQLALHRLSETQVQAAACVVPQDFDFAVYADRAGRYEDQGTVRLMARFTSAAAEHLRETPLSADQVLHELADGAQVDVVATVSLDQPLRWWLRGFGSQVEVLEPASLRAEMQADVQLLAATYANPALPAARSFSSIAKCGQFTGLMKGRMMAGSDWGLLGPDRVPSNRRTRTLGLGRAVRRFNELAVPGLGGLWYGRQALYTVLAMAVAKRLRTWNIRRSHIEVANAIEAVACTIGYRHNGWSPDWRMRGRNKLSHDVGAPSFKQACRSSYYVSQPMRMSTAQALPSLGLASAPSVRFNAFECSEEADVFLGSSIGHLLVGKNSLVDHLCYWVMGSPLSWKSHGVVAALNPLEGLDEDARHWLRHALLKGATLTEQQCQRRKAAWDWMACLHAEPGSVASLDDVQGPAQLDAAHWHDLRAGTKLVDVRNAAVAVLDSVEVELDARQRRSLQLDGTLPLPVHQALQALVVHAQSFLALNHYDEDANRFCSECVGNEADVLRALLRRDDQVLCLVDDCARPGPAYSGRPPVVEKGEQGADEEVAETGRNGLPLPAGISYRVENLYLLYLDLAGELGVAITTRNTAPEVTA